MNAPTIGFHGAAGTVTGSCMEIRFGGRRILVDCGLFQGPRTIEALNFGPLPFKPAEIDAIILTHAHIDHSGLVPRLVAEGFAGRVHATHATRDLLRHMWPDSGRIHEHEAERRNRRPDRADEPPVEPIYTEADAVAALDALHPRALGEWFEPAPGFRVRLWNAGHILGSASVELEVGGVRLLASGDLGPEHKSFHPDPQAPHRLDHVICESTYGDRDRADIDKAGRRRLLEAEIKAALGRGGNLLIPVFALERTQELLLDIATLIAERRIDKPYVFIDSPLASRATEIFAQHADELEDVSGGEIFDNPAFHYVASVAESMRLNKVKGAIIMAASGMCEGGRIRHHLRHHLGSRQSTVLFVGYQAGGTLGRTILEGAKRVRISGRDVVVRAEIRRLDCYSAHADKASLLDWIKGRAPIAGSLFLSHGEAAGRAALKAAAEERHLASHVLLPLIGEAYALPAGAPARRLQTGREDILAALEGDWQNDYADFATALKARLRAIDDAAARREALARMSAILESYKRARH
ncbi:MAG: MBL fold metallo-hydrolase [Polymorphobacter sp.]|uniref:MBL fold metallo-hydrolase n=1 Tax=Polymorphobacter sp. TaxID=1909290 RepID=UPI003A84DB59